MARVHLDATGLRDAACTERGLEFVQQAAVIGVAVVLAVELPVAEGALSLIAENADLLAEDAVEMVQEHRAKIMLEWLSFVAEGREDHARIGRDAQRLEIVLLHLEGWCHPALALEAAAKRQTHELAVEAVAPAVIDAGVVACVAARLAAHQGPFVCTAVDDDMQRSIERAIHNDRGLADIARPEVAGIRDFRFKPDE